MGTSAVSGAQWWTDDRPFESDLGVSESGRCRRRIDPEQT
jgi:hypothetical protein